MDGRTSGASPRWRSTSLVLAGVLLGVVLLSPVAADVRTPAHLWRSHLKNKAAKLIDQRALRKGRIVISHSGEWGVSTSFGDGFVDPTEGGDTIVANSNVLVAASMDIVSPVRLGRRFFGLKQVYICYFVTAGGKIDFTRVSHNTGTTVSIVLNDNTDRTGAACFTLTAPTPIEPEGSLVLSLRFQPDTGGDEVIIRTVTTTWVPTGVAPS